MATFRQNFHTNLVQQLIDNVYYNKSNLYYFVGSVSPQSDDSRPTESDFANDKDTFIRDNIVFFKKISAEDITAGCRRIDWKKPATKAKTDSDGNVLYIYEDTLTGEVYDQWDNTKDMVTPQESVTGATVYKNFYVMCEDDDVESQYNVYKCLNNNFGARSLGKPTGDSIEPFKTVYTDEHGELVEDGYIWKYLYSIPAIKSRKFMTSTMMPVQRSISETFYTNGAIESITVVEGGSGYPTNNTTYVNVITNDDDPTVGCTLYRRPPTRIEYELNPETKGISKIVIPETDYGYGYFPKTGYGIEVTISDEGHRGDNAVLEPIIKNGTLTGIDIISSGTNYTENARITVTEPPTGRDNAQQRTLQVSLNSEGGIIAVNSTDVGYYYIDGLPNYAIIGNGHAKYDNLPTAVIKFNNRRVALPNGDTVNTIDSVSIIDPGVGYINTSTLSLTISGDGIGASAVPEINSNGEVVSVHITNSGIGYTFANLNITGSSGKGAVMTAKIGGSRTESRQSVVEQLAAHQEGAIYAYGTDHFGEGYNKATTVFEVNGDGVGAIVQGVWEGSVLIGVYPVSYGKGYTYASVTVKDKNRIGTDFEEFKCHAILPPRKGHGHDAINELYGKYVITYVTLKESDTELSSLNQDYRQFGIISNLRTYNMNNLCTKNTSVPMYEFRLAKSQEDGKSISDYENIEDTEVIIVHEDQNVKHRIVSVSGADTVKVQQMSYILKDIEVGDPLTLTTTDKNGITHEYNFEIEEILHTPDVDKYSGDLMTMANIAPVYVSKEHTIGVRTYIKF